MTFHLATERVAAPSTGRVDRGQCDALVAQALLAQAHQQGLAVAVKSADDGCYQWANDAFAALFGTDTPGLVGRTDADWLDTSAAAQLRSADHTALAQGAELASEHRFDLRGERREFKVLRVVSPAADKRLICSIWHDLAPQRQRDGQLRLALGQLEQQQKANDALRLELAGQGLRDQASGLNSRAHFDDQMRRELDLSTREHREFALVYMALDPFNVKAGALGAPAQDRICEAMGRLLRGNTRVMDASCRMDDRHFAVLLSGVGLATAHSRMEGLRRQCATQIVMLDGQELGFSVAMGVASFPHTAQGHDELVTACSAALAEAKRRGGNTVALASIRFEAGG
ncbi:MAG: diguanylate cyclase [Aquabacterium sp.]|nr:diguanylate cyclase [Aquabacterium sp.]